MKKFGQNKSIIPNYKKKLEEKLVKKTNILKA